MVSESKNKDIREIRRSCHYDQHDYQGNVKKLVSFRN